MTTMLETAFSEAAKLSPQDQDSLAEWLLSELRADQRWKKAFAQSPDALAALANEALEAYRAQRTEPLDPERM